MFCISVSFKKASLMLREQMAFSQQEQKKFLSQLMTSGIINGGVIVSTCNRSELYLTGVHTEEESPAQGAAFQGKRRETIENLLSEFKQIDKEFIKKYCLYYQGEKAVKHLFKVVCGLDSMVLGEDQILHQVKEAYLFSDENGFTDSELNIIFQNGFHCAKQSKSLTKLSNTPISVGTLTANTIEHYMKDAEKKEKVLVIGATGKIGSIVVRNLVDKGFCVIATKRKKYSAHELFLQDDIKMRWIDFERRYEFLSEVSAVVSATSSPHYTLTKEEFQKNAGKGKQYLLIDLAVPYDIDKEIGEEKHISLLDIDYFKTCSEKNSNIKQSEIEKVNYIIQECVDDVMKELYVQSFKYKIAMKDRDRQEQWFNKMIYYLKDVLNSRQLLQILEKIYQNEVENVK